MIGGPSTYGTLSGVDQVVSAARYKPGWKFMLVGQAGGARVLEIAVETLDSSSGLPVKVTHLFPVPTLDCDHWAVWHWAVWDNGWSLEEWGEWLFERILEVERHESGEFFALFGQRVKMPTHFDLHRSPYELPPIEIDRDRDGRPIIALRPLDDQPPVLDFVRRRRPFDDDFYGRP